MFPLDMTVTRDGQRSVLATGEPFVVTSARPGLHTVELQELGDARPAPLPRCLRLCLACLSEWVACVRSNFLVLCYLHDVKNTLQLHDLATGALLKTFPLQVGSIVGYSGQKKDTEIFYQFTSFLSPGESLSPEWFF